MHRGAQKKRNERASPPEEILRKRQEILAHQYQNQGAIQEAICLELRRHAKKKIGFRFSAIHGETETNRLGTSTQSTWTHMPYGRSSLLRPGPQYVLSDRRARPEKMDPVK